MTRTLPSLCVVACLLYVTSVQSADPITEEPGFHLNPSIIERRTDSMILVWDEPHGGVLGYQIHLSKSDSDDLITTPELDSGMLEYKLKNLMVQSVYEICLMAATNQVEQPAGHLVFNEKECITGTTVDKIRSDSIIAVCIAVGYILAMAILGYICWAITKRRIDANREAREEALLAEEEEAEEEKEPTPPLTWVTHGIPKPEPPRPKTPELVTPKEALVTVEVVSEAETEPKKSATPELKQPKPAQKLEPELPAPQRTSTPEPISKPPPQKPEQPNPRSPESAIPANPGTPELAPAPKPLVAKPPRPHSPQMTSTPKSESPPFRRLKAKPKLAPLASMEDSMDDLMELCEPSYP